MKYAIRRETAGEFADTGETFDSATDDAEAANTAAQAHVEELQRENGGCYAAQVIEE